MSALSPSAAAMVRWRIEDMDAEGAAAELVAALGLDGEAARLIENAIREAFDSGYCDGHRDAVNGARHKVLNP